MPLYGYMSKEIVKTVRYAGPSGIRAADVIFVCGDQGIGGTAQGIRGTLSNLARRGVIDYRNGRYFEKMERPDAPFTFEE